MRQTTLRLDTYAFMGVVVAIVCSLLWFLSRQLCWNC